MGVDLEGIKGGSFYFNWSGWSKVFRTTHKYGWNPKGTKSIEQIDTDTGEVVIPEDKNWDGTYFTNDYQLVTDMDVAGITKALRKALPTLKRKEDPRWVNRVEEFVQFAEKGGFYIG